MNNCEMLKTNFEPWKSKMNELYCAFTGAASNSSGSSSQGTTNSATTSTTTASSTNSCASSGTATTSTTTGNTSAVSNAYKKNFSQNFNKKKLKIFTTWATATTQAPLQIVDVSRITGYIDTVSCIY